MLFVYCIKRVPAPANAGGGNSDINLDVVWDTVKVALPEMIESLPSLRRHAEDTVRDHPS